MKYKQCLRCGRHIKEETNRLWCDRCLEKVNAELRGETNKPFQYFFRHHLKQMEKERDLFGQKGEFGAGKTLNRMLRGG